MLDPAEFLLHPFDVLISTGSSELRVIDVSEFPDKDALVYAVYKLSCELLSESGSVSTVELRGKGGLCFER